MPIVVQCPHCHARYSAPDHLGGEEVRCPQCQNVVTVSSEGAGHGGASEPAAAEPTPKTTSPNARQQPSQDAPSESESEIDDDEPLDEVSFRDRGEREEGDMDMTPMVDVTFLLLIFFMVTAAFSLQKSLEIPTPTESDDPSLRAEQQETEEDPDTVIVYVDAFNTYRVITMDWEEEAPSEQELNIKLKLARQGDSKGNVPTRLLVKANGDALHEKVVAALDAGSQVGMEEIQLQKVEEDDF